jgi:DNA uptake protein ComE-like DNA-binding protein
VRRGSVILAVMVVVTIAALTGATGVYLARSQAAVTSGSLKRTQSRALAWSGVQAAMAEMADQREKLLDGEAPDVTREWDLYATESGERGVVRLVALTSEESGGEGRGGAVAVSEQARLDLNIATKDMLAALGLEPGLAQAIVAGKGDGYQSVEELLRVPGITAAVLKGEAGLVQQGAAEEMPGAGQWHGALTDVVTVMSFDPNIQAGLGENGADYKGKLRVNLHQPWSDRLATAIDDRFGEGSSKIVKSFIDKGTEFKTMADIVGALRTMHVEVKDWAGVLDAFTVSADMYAHGKVDINRAPARVLYGVPGIDATAAEQIVHVREKLDAAARRSVTWPLVEGLMTEEQFARGVDYITTRSMQWRVRVEAGILPAPPPGVTQRAEHASLRDRVILEAVIDVASERPRVAYLRDVTVREAAEVLYRDVIAAGQAEEDEEIGPRDVMAGLGAAEDAPPPAPEAAESPLMDLGGLNLAGGLKPQRDMSVTTMSEGLVNMDFGGLDLGMDEDEREPVGPPVPDEVVQEQVKSGPDRRLGRWNVPKKEGAAP